MLPLYAKSVNIIPFLVSTIIYFFVDNNINKVIK